MNREIKFRAINANHEMIYGLPYTDGVNDTIYYKEYSNRLCWRDESGAHCNQPYKNGTLMQFTGLTDKNGKDVYDKDIILASRSKYIVEWENHKWVYSKPKGKKFSYMNYDHYNLTFGDPRVFIEVIGNIYENPELLTKQ